MLVLLCLPLIAGVFGEPIPPVDPNIVNPTPLEKVPLIIPEERDDLFEGDMIVPKESKFAVMRNAVRYNSRHWIAAVVPFEYDDSVGNSMKSYIEEAIQEFKDKTCIHFVPRQGEKDFVKFQSPGKGCYAYLGKAGGEQPLHLEDPGWFAALFQASCKSKGIIIHEMLHTIGFAHEQSRTDRDNHITVHFDRIKDKMESQFRKLSKYEENHQDLPYDYSSVMHYGAYAFSKSGKTITTRDPSKQSLIGQRQGFSKQDIEEVNKLYNCDGKKPQSDNCQDKIGQISCRNLIRKHGGNACKHGDKNDLTNECANTCRQC